MNQIYPKRGFLVEKENIEYHHWILHLGISLGVKFQVKLAIFILWTKFAQNGNFQYKRNKIHKTTEFWIFELVLVLNFSLNWQFWYLDQIYQKRGFPVKNRKKEHHHWILHIQISLPNCWLKLKILIFDFVFDWICPKRVFPVENGKSALVRASMVVFYNIKLFCTEAHKHNDILKSLKPLVY